MSQDMANLGTIVDVNNNSAQQQTMWRCSCVPLTCPCVCVCASVPMCTVAVLTMLGYMRSDLVEQNINVLIPNPFAENHQDHLIAMLRTGLYVRTHSHAQLVPV